MTATTTTNRLRARLAYLREEEYRAHQALLVSEPCTYRHVRCHGDWRAARAQIELLEELIESEQENE